jgi:hypothetical protein
LERVPEENRKLIVGLSPVFQGIGFKNFLDGIQDIGRKERDEFSVSINFLKQKYIHIPMWTRAVMTNFATMVFTVTFVKIQFFS